MSIVSTNAVSLRVGRTLFWVTPYTTKFLFYFERKLSEYLLGVLNSIDQYSIRLREKSALTVGLRKTKTPPLRGSFRLSYNYSGYTLFFSYYFDVLMDSPLLLRLLERRLSQLSLKLGLILGCEFRIINFNYFHHLLYHVMHFQRFVAKDFTEVLLLASTYTQIKCFFFYKSITKLYDYLLNLSKLKRYKRNQYFHRIFNILFSVFAFKKFDLVLMSNAIAYEFKNLRKRHKAFVGFLKDIIALLFFVFKDFSSLRGLRLVIKGRMVPFTRQLPMAQKKVLSFGYLDTSDYSQFLQSANSLAKGRFGVISITLTIQVFSVLVVDRLVSNTFLNYPKANGFFSFTYFSFFINYFSMTTFSKGATSSRGRFNIFSYKLEGSRLLPIYFFNVFSSFFGKKSILRKRFNVNLLLLNTYWSKLNIISSFTFSFLNSTYTKLFKLPNLYFFYSYVNSIFMYLFFAKSLKFLFVFLVRSLESTQFTFLTLKSVLLRKTFKSAFQAHMLSSFDTSQVTKVSLDNLLPTTLTLLRCIRYLSTNKSSSYFRSYFYSYFLYGYYKLFFLKVQKALNLSHLPESFYSFVLTFIAKSNALVRQPRVFLRKKLCEKSTLTASNLVTYDYQLNSLKSKFKFYGWLTLLYR